MIYDFLNVLNSLSHFEYEIKSFSEDALFARQRIKELKEIIPAKKEPYLKLI